MMGNDTTELLLYWPRYSEVKFKMLGLVCHRAAAILEAHGLLLALLEPAIAFKHLLLSTLTGCLHLVHFSGQEAAGAWLGALQAWEWWQRWRLILTHMLNVCNTLESLFAMSGAEK